MAEVQVGKHRLFYDDQGTGEPLVLLSGLGGDHRAFGVSIRHFSSRFRVLAVDNRDSGRSDRADGPYSTADLADDVAGWLDQLGITRASVLGHSLGGLIAQELVIRHPSKVARLILASTHAGSNPWRKAVIESWIIARKALESGDFARVTMPLLVAPPFFHVPPQVDGLIRFAERNEWPQSADAFERQARAAIDHDARGRLGSFRVATLVLAGGLDLVNPLPVAQELADQIPGAQLEIMPMVGHLPHIENGPKFREVVGRFLESSS